MRIVAVILALVLLPLSIPGALAAPHDACSNQVAHPKPCVRIDVTQAGQSKTFYVYAAAYECATKFQDSSCRGEGSGGRTLPGGDFWGFVYEETNKYPGLQRYQLVLPDGTTYPADKMVLY